MPRTLSPTMEEGCWPSGRSQGRRQDRPTGDIIAEVETDKANLDFPLEGGESSCESAVKAGDTVKLGGPVGILGDAGKTSRPCSPKPVPVGCSGGHCSRPGSSGCSGGGGRSSGSTRRSRSP